MAETSGGAAPAADVSTPTEASGEAAPSTPRMLKLMLDGKETEFSETEVVGNMKRGREAAKLMSLAEQRRQEAFLERSKYEGLISRAKKGGPEARAALKEMGFDLGNLARDHFLEEIHQERLTPEERREAELQRQLQGYKDKEAQAEEEKKTAAHKAEEEKHVERFAQVFTDAMTLAGFPKEAASAAFPHMARLYAENERAGLESTPEEMAHHAVRGFRTTLESATKGLDGQALLEFIGPDLVRKLLTANLQRPAAPRAPGVSPLPSTTRQKPPQGSKRGGEEWFDKLIRG